MEQNVTLETNFNLTLSYKNAKLKMRHSKNNVVINNTDINLNVYGYTVAVVL